MQRHWLRYGPPAYMTAAAKAGWKPREAELEEDGGFVNPEDLGSFLTGFPGGRVA